MIRYLLQRPVAVLISFMLAIVIGLYSFPNITTSLLPIADAPIVYIRVESPSLPAADIEDNVLSHLRQSFDGLLFLESVESQAVDFAGLIQLRFAFEAPMPSLLLQINERLDRCMIKLPPGMQRPQVQQSSFDDLPIVRIHVIPTDSTLLAETANFANFYLKNRLEQLSGVAYIDVSKTEGQEIVIRPDLQVLTALGTTPEGILRAISQSDADLGNLKIVDGQYSYFARLSNRRPINELLRLPVLLPEGGTVTLGKIASISIGNSPALGHHFFGEEPAVGLAIFKNGDGRLEQVMLQVNNLIAEVQKNNPKFKFYTSQDQSFLLEAGISNLKQDLIAGGVFTILLLFSLLGNWRLPLIISITIPVSLIMTFSLFKLFNLSFNIVSLSGLSLAVGCVVDNTIVVLNRVMQRHYQGMVISQASETGVKEMAIPVLSQVVTTVAVYLPLVFLSGMAGILLGEQGLALTIALTVSLAVAFILAPLIATNLFHSKATVASEDTRIYQWISKGYHQMISAVLRKPILFLCITILFMPVGIFLLQYLPTTALPNIDIKDTRIVIDWENNVSVEGNKERTHRLLKWLKDKTLTQEADVAFGMYLGNILPTTQRSVVYFTCENAESRIVLDSCVKEYISKTFPRANVKIEPAPNPLFQLFENTGADVDIRLYPSTEDWISGDAMNHIEKLVSQPKFQLYELYPKVYAQKAYYLDIDETALHIYRVTKEEVIRACQEALGEMNIPFKQGNTLSITMMGADSNFKELLSWPLQSDKGGNYSLGNFVHFSLVVVPSVILADQQGVYFSLKMNRGQPPTQASIYPLPAEWNAAIHGSYVYNRKLLQQLELIFVIVIILIYITLAIQYENLVQPLIVMLSIPLGISGAVFLLWIFGFGLNVMTAAGFIVVLGLIVDDPILKVETLNRLAKYRFNHSLPLDAEAIGEMIHEAGHLCLKPLLLVSLTTSAALIPALIIPGFGNQLQKPMAVVIIGGLTIGTFFTTWFIPLAYWYMVKWKWIRFRFENK